MYLWEVVGFNQVNNTHVNDLGKLTLEKKNTLILRLNL